MMNGSQLLDRIRPREHRLENGLTLLIREDHSAPVVAIVTHVRAGYFDEPDRLVGISHVLEHMFFKGTERRGVGEIARQTKAAGGFLNAGTIYDHTSYYTVLPSSALEMGLEIQADALIHSQIDEEELRKELLVIIQEVNRKFDNPAAMATEKLYEAMFDVHPMRRWRMGTEEALQRLERKDVVEYYRSMYRGRNTTLVVAGDVDPARVIDRVEALYAELPPGDVERPDRSEPERTGTRFRERSADIAHSYVELGWRSPGALDTDTPAMDALGVVLGQGRASRLYRSVRERGLVSDIDAYNYTPREIGVFGVSLECEPEATVDAIRATMTEVERLRSEPPSDDELDRVRTLLEARFLRRLETAQGQANLLAEWEAMGGWRKAGAFLEQVRTLSPDDLQSVADRHLDPDRLTLLVYRPESAEAIGWSDGELPEAIRSDAAAVPTREPTEGAPDRAVERTSLSTPAVLSGLRREDRVIQYDMEGGRLVVKPRSRAPLVSMAIAARGGSLQETVATAGITSLMMRTSVKGTTARSAERIARESEALGGGIGAGAGSDQLSWSLTVPSEHFLEGFGLLSDVAMNPVFPEEEVKRERGVLLSDLDQLRDDMYRYPLRLLLGAAFGDHPYGHGPEAMEEAIVGVGSDSLQTWHASEVAEPWVFIVGDVDPERVAAAVAERVGTPARRVLREEPKAVWPESPQLRSVSRDRAQTALAVAFPGPDRMDDDRIVLEVLSNAISGLGNRLFEELRSRRSLAYTVNAYPISRRHAGAFVGYIATSPEKAEEARQGMLHELLRLRDKRLGEEEVERARRYTLGAWQIRTQTNAAQLSELASALMVGGGLEEIRTFEDRIRGVTHDDILEVARRWFDPDRLVEGAVHGRD